MDSLSFSEKMLKLYTARRRRFIEHRVRHRLTKLEVYYKATVNGRQVDPEADGMTNLWMATDGIGFKSLKVQAVEKADELASEIGKSGAVSQSLH
jgi:hypothetical protein